MDRNNLLTTTETAAILGVRPNTLVVWRCAGRYRLPWVRVGRLIRYERKAIERFISDNTVDGEHERQNRD